MNNSKISKLIIEHFRGISDELSLSFDMKGNAESALIFGDNGSGKSSIIDAIEFITQGSIQGNQSGKAGGWIYNSVSLENKERARVDICLNDNEQYEASFVRNEEEGKICAEKGVIQQFRYAPFVLRRMDILNFWGEQTQRKLMLFFKYVKTDTAEMVISDSEISRIIEQQRIENKNEKRALLEEICR